MMWISGRTFLLFSLSFSLFTSLNHNFLRPFFSFFFFEKWFRINVFLYVSLCLLKKKKIRSIQITIFNSVSINNRANCFSCVLCDLLNIWLYGIWMSLNFFWVFSWFFGDFQGLTLTNTCYEQFSQLFILYLSFKTLKMAKFKLF